LYILIDIRNREQKKEVLDFLKESGAKFETIVDAIKPTMRVDDGVSLGTLSHIIEQGHSFIFYEQGRGPKLDMKNFPVFRRE
jgi:hypothetical protein